MNQLAKIAPVLMPVILLVLVLVLVIMCSILPSVDAGNTGSIYSTSSTSIVQEGLTRTPQDRRITVDSTSSSSSTSTLSTSTSSTPSQYIGYYDDLRSTPLSNFVSVKPLVTGDFEDTSSYIGRNLHQITPTSPIDGHDSIKMCHVPTFLRYSNDIRFSSSFSCAVAYAGSVGAMLAMHHFNNGIGTIAPELRNIHERCNIRFTTEVVDTASSPMSAARSMGKMITRDHQSISEPQPCAVFGAQISTVTQKLATLTSVFGLLQISSSAMSTELDNGKQYPLLARSHTDVAGFGEMSISYLKYNMNVEKFALLVPNDGYGLSFQSAVLEAAAQEDLLVYSASYLPSFETTSEFRKEIRKALGRLKDLGYNYFVAAFYPEVLELIMEEAYLLDLVGPGKFWIISGTADTAPTVLSGNFVIRKDSLAAKAIIGNGIIFCEGGVPGKGGTYDKFWDEWKKVGNTSEILNYMNSKQPLKSEIGQPLHCSKTENYFQSKPNHIVTFSYDAIVALGLSACEADVQQSSMNQNEKNNDGDGDSKIFTGSDHHRVLSSKEFQGASGTVTLRPNFPTRMANSSYFIMVNLMPNSVNETHMSFKGSQVKFFYESSEARWKIAGNGDFVYSDGSIFPPVELVSLPGNSTINNIVFPVAGSLSVVLLVLAVAFIFMKRQFKRADAIWRVAHTELKFDEPAQIIGRGTFGLVVLAQYRGTQVAVKRVIPPKQAVECGVGSRRIFNVGSQSIPNEQNSGTKKEGSVSDKQDNHTDETASDIEGGFQDNIPSQLMSSEQGKSSMSAKFSRRRFMSTRMSKHSYMKNEFMKEMRLLSKLRHPCITTVMGAVCENRHEPMLVMEYMDHGSLFDMIQNVTIALDYEIIIPILQDIAQGILFLHRATPQVIHGDLKAANVLVDSRNRAKVADFGLSQKKRMGATGTPYWMAPELLRGDSVNTATSDVYSFGMIIYEVVTRNSPYNGEEFIEVVKGITDPKIQKRPVIPLSCPPQFQSLVYRCLVENPDERPNFESIYNELSSLDPIDFAKRFAIPGEQRLHRDLFQRTDKLLFNVFPKHIAEALRDGRKVQPESRDVVTIFFSDIVGFTEISSILPPLKISDLLDRLYHQIDDLTHEHDVFKVETIGDAYMAVTNLVKDQTDHAKRIARFAIDVINIANTTLIDLDDKKKGFVQLRVGFHSGPVVANVVGSRNPRYCLFGDTVNTASRMESSSETNRIHCSERAANLLREQDDRITIENRGVITVKGKGQMLTCWVSN